MNSVLPQMNSTLWKFFTSGFVKQPWSKWAFRYTAGGYGKKKDNPPFDAGLTDALPAAVDRSGGSPLLLLLYMPALNSCIIPEASGLLVAWT
jgi:hypothetical protein